MKIKKIYINGRFLTQTIVGVQRSAIDILIALDKLLVKESKLKVILIAPSQAKDIQLDNIELIKKGFLQGYLWEQLLLPIYVGRHFLISLCNSGPLIKRNQIVTLHDAAIFDGPEWYTKAFIWRSRFIFKILARRVNEILTVSFFHILDCSFF